MDGILSKFLEFERDEGLFTRKYRGVNYWQCIRCKIGKKNIRLKTKATTSDQIQKKKNYAIRVFSILKECICDFKKGIFLKESDLLYFDQQASRYIDGQQVDPYFDFWGLHKRFSVQRCYYSEVNEDRTRGRNAGIGVAAAELMQGILYCLSKYVPKLFADVQEDKFIRDLCDKMCDRFDAVISKKQMIQTVRDIVIRHKVYGKYYYWLIKRVKPKAIVVVCHFDSKLFPLYEVAHKCHVPVIELEHGLVSNHEAYNYMDLTSEGKMLPDYFFIYGEFWKQYIQLPFCMQPIAVGNPFLDSQRRKYRDAIPDENTIVFYSDEIGIEQAQFVIDFYKRNVGSDYKVCFKPHPREYPHLRELYSIFESYPEIQIIPQEMNLYELLAGAKHHVSAISTVLFEAAIFDVKRYVMYRPEWIQYIQPLIDIGLAKAFHNLDELQELLNEKEAVDRSMVDFIWKRNARKNAMEVLENMISGKSLE